MKKLLFLAILSLLTPYFAYAIDETSTIPEKDMEMVKKLTSEMRIKNPSNKLLKNIHNTFGFALKENWYSYWIGNDDLESSKIRNEKYRHFEYLISNEDRFYSISYMYFPPEKQIHYVTREFVTRGSSVVLKAFNTAKSSGTYEILNETDKYGFLHEKGKAMFGNFQVAPESGGISYITYGTIDVDQ